MADVVDDGHVLIQSADDDDLSSCFSPQYFTFLKKILWIFLKFNLTFFERKVNSDNNLIDS